MEKYDVVIVGAGLAGLQCAQLCARQGLRVRLVDRKSQLDQLVHTTGIFVRRTLEDFALPENCLGPAIRQVRMYSPARRCQLFVSKNTEFRVGKMGPLYCRLLEEAQQVGVEWSCDTSFIGSRADRNGSTVDLQRGGAHGESEKVFARLLIGADGAASRVATDLKLSQNRRWLVGVEQVFEGVITDGPPTLHCFIDPRLAPGYIAWVAHDGEETHIGVAGYEKRFEPRQALATFVREMKGRFDMSRAELIEQRGGRIPVGGILPKIANERGLLVGDAAGAVSPLTAGGLDPCLRQTTLAARLITEFFETGNARVFDSYSPASLRRKFWVRNWLRRAFAAVNSPLLAEGACWLMHTRPFDGLARHIFFGKGSFPIDLTPTNLVGPLPLPALTQQTR